jgi:hypothetical protein
MGYGVGAPRGDDTPLAKLAFHWDERSTSREHPVFIVVQQKDIHRRGTNRDEIRAVDLASPLAGYYLSPPWIATVK